jgi:hypothetical protein
MREPAAHADGLEAILPREFRDNLRKAERRLLRAAPSGGWSRGGSNFNNRDNDPAKADNPPNAGGWGRDREIRADLIRWLCVNQEASRRVDPRGVRVYGARITGELDLSSANVPFPLRLVRCRLVSKCHLQNVRIRALQLDGTVAGSLTADGAEVDGDCLLSRGFSANGEVRLPGARLGGNLDCSGSTFKNPGGVALTAAGARIGGDVFVSDDFFAEGQVSLLGAQIGGQLSCAGGSFRNAGSTALIADTADVKGGVYLKNASEKLFFHAEGEVNLVRARIGGNLECDHGSFKNPCGDALTANTAEIAGNVFLREGFSAQGKVDLVLARVGGEIDCRKATFEALDLHSATAAQKLLLQEVRAVTDLDLRDAAVQAMWDDEGSWPSKGHLRLDGFVYERISSGPTDALKRLEWLDRQAEFKSQPYRQLAKVLREMGEDEGARRVLFELEKRARSEGRRRLVAPTRWLRFAEDALSKATVGYGIHPGWAVWHLCWLTALGWIVHRRAQRLGVMAPSDKDAYREFHENNATAPPYYPQFSPLIYSLENCLPLVKFGQDDRWQPDPSALQRVRLPRPARGSRAWFRDVLFVRLPDLASSPVALRWFRWVLIALGWLLATFFVAGITGIIKTE